MMEVASLVVAIVSVCITVGSLVYARCANKLASESNNLAERAHETALEANKLAVDANKLATDANSIAARSLAVSSDQLVYDWGIRFDEDGREIILVNKSAHAASDVAVLVCCEGEPVGVGRFDYVSALGEFGFPCERVFLKLVEEREEWARARAEFVIAGRARVEVSVRVSWLSEFGVSRTAVIDECLCE